MVVSPWVLIIGAALLVVLAASVVVLILRLRREYARPLPAENVNRLNMSLSGADEALWEFDLPRERAQYSERYAEMLGYSLAEMGRKMEDLRKLMHPDDLPGAQERLDAHLEGRSKLYQAEFRLKTKSGGWRWVQSRGKVVERAPDGTPIRVAGTHQDITLRKQAEQALESERDLLASIMDYLPEHVYFKDRDSRFLRASRSLAKLFGVGDPLDLVGKCDADFFSAEHANQALADERALLDGKVPIISKEEKETWPDGHETWVLTTKLPYRDRTGAVIGTFGISRDITADKRMEKDLKEAKAAVEAAHRAAHDTKEEISLPIGSVSGHG